MKILVVHAHPEPQSFSTALFNQTNAAFTAAGHDVRTSDLYEMNWNPVASAADFGRRANADYLVYALEQRENASAGTLAADIADELDKLLWCDALVLNFPLYWFSVPAILKGWIDRVFISGTVYGGTRFYDRGGLRGRKAAVSLTCGGRDHMFANAGIHGSIETLLAPLLRGSLGYAGLDVAPPFVGYHVPYVSADARTAILQAHRSWLNEVWDLPCLPVPALEGFDREMRPLPRVSPLQE